MSSPEGRERHPGGVGLDRADRLRGELLDLEVRPDPVDRPLGGPRHALLVGLPLLLVRQGSRVVEPDQLPDHRRLKPGKHVLVAQFALGLVDSLRQPGRLFGGCAGGRLGHQLPHPVPALVPAQSVLKVQVQDDPKRLRRVALPCLPGLLLLVPLILEDFQQRNRDHCLIQHLGRERTALRCRRITLRQFGHAALPMSRRSALSGNLLLVTA